MPRCSFCGITIEAGTGTMFVKNDGKIFNFCSMKCNKNLRKLKRAPKKIQWTRAYRKAKVEVKK